MTNESSEKTPNPFFISKQKRRGLYGLIILVTLIIFLPRILFNLSKQHNEIEITKFNEKNNESKKEITLKEHSKKKVNRNSKSRYNRLKSKTKLSSISVQDWQNLGLSDKQAKVVFSIISRGIKNEKELMEIKYLPNKLFNMIKDSLIYDKQSIIVDSQDEFEKHTFENKTILEINSCTKEELIEIPGIGDYTAKSIVKFRDALGGFYRKEQLLEVYNMRLENYDKMIDYLFIDTLKIRKININSAEYKLLVSHPYLSSNQSNSILKMRRQQENNYKNIKEILRSVLIDEETFNKLRPYIDVK